MASNSDHVRMHRLCIYIGACIFLLCIFNVLLDKVLHQKVHVSGTELAKQVYDLQLDTYTDKDVISALATAHGFLLDEHVSPNHFLAFMHEKSEVFTYKAVALKLYHWPSWVVESHLFIIFNLIVIGASAWGYRWCCLFYRRYEKKVRKAPLQLQKAFSENSRHQPSEEDVVGQFYGLHQSSHHFFALMCWQHSLPDVVDLENHLKLVITKGFSELPKVSVKSLKSGGVAITLDCVPQTQLEKHTYQLHEIIYQAALVYRGDLCRKEIKIGVCNYRTGADQTIVYQLTKSALEQAKLSIKQHIQRIPFTYTHAKVLKKDDEDLPEYIAKKKFILFFQPLFELNSGEMIQHEALIRIRHKSLGLLSAKQFIPHLKTDIAVIQLDMAVIEHVLVLLKSEPSSLTVSINLHSFNWFNEQFWSWFAKKVCEFEGMSKLQFEISADDFYLHHQKLGLAFEQIKLIGGAVLIDNVLSSDKLSILASFKQLRGIKLGYEVIHGIDRNLKLQKTVRQIVIKSNQLKLPVFGVGVETREELNTLKALGVSAAQGFYFTEPLQEFTQVTS